MRDRARRLERALAPQQRLQVGAVDVPHRDEEASVGLARLVHGDDVRVVEARREPRLAQQPLAEAGVVGEPLQEDLQRDAPPEPLVAREVDLPHAAAADQLLDEVLGDGRSDSDVRLDGQCRPLSSRRAHLRAARWTDPGGMLDGSIADDQLRAGTVSPVKAPASDAKRKRRRKTLRWFVIYTLALLAIAAVSVWKHQWSVAADDPPHRRGLLPHDALVRAEALRIFLCNVRTKGVRECG